jgi:peptide/nickel transport system permease protein
VLSLIGRRLALSLPLLLLVPTVTYFLAALIPGDMARTILGMNASQAQYQQLRQSLGLNEPLLSRYFSWLGSALHGNLGASLSWQQPVAAMLNSRLEVTLSLVIGSTVVAAAAGVTLGVAAALRANAAGRVVDGIAMAGLAIPNFFLGLLLVSWFAVTLRVFPATGYTPFGQSPGGWLSSITLPVITLAATGVAMIAKQTRDSMREVLDRPFIRTLRAAGVPDRSIIARHALRNAAIPVVTVTSLFFIASLGGAVLVESVFALPGLGTLVVQATSQHDLPLIQGVAVYFTIAVVCVNLLVDLAYSWLDPRVRVS